MNLKFGILTNMPTPYRNGMWKSYSQVKDVDIDIYYCTRKENDRYWEVVSTAEMTEKYLAGISLSTQTHINFGIIKVFKKYDAWIIGGYSIPTCQLLIVLCKIYNVPYVIMIDGVNPLRLIEENKIKSAFKRFFIKDQFLSLANGESGKKLVMKYGLKEDKVLNQYLTVDVDYFLAYMENKENYRTEIRKKYNVDNKDIVLLYVGRIIKGKGIQDLILASKILKERGFPIKVMIVGEGEYKFDLERELPKTSDIIFCGEVDYSSLYKYYYSADIFVLPTYDDAWGLTINEAMACGLPIITTIAAGAYLDLIVNNGIAYEPGNIKGLVSSISQLMGEENYSNKDSTQIIQKRLRVLGENSVRIIKHYKFNNSKKEFEKLVQQVKDYLESS